MVLKSCGHYDTVAAVVASVMSLSLQALVAQGCVHNISADHVFGKKKRQQQQHKQQTTTTTIGGAGSRRAARREEGGVMYK